MGTGGSLPAATARVLVATTLGDGWEASASWRIRLTGYVPVGSGPIDTAAQIIGGAGLKLTFSAESVTLIELPCSVATVPVGNQA